MFSYVHSLIKAEIRLATEDTEDSERIKIEIDFVTLLCVLSELCGKKGC